MVAHTSFGAFSGEPMEWEDYVERLENFFVAHDIKSETKEKAVLFSECRATTYAKIPLTSQSEMSSLLNTGLSCCVAKSMYGISISSSFRFVLLFLMVPCDRILIDQLIVYQISNTDTCKSMKSMQCLTII